jgi:hypothetical protein
MLQQSRAGYSSAVKQWTADEDELIRKGERPPNRSAKAARNRHKRKFGERASVHASVHAATPVSVRTAAPAASPATRVNSQPRRAGRQLAATLAASTPATVTDAPTQNEQELMQVEDSSRSLGDSASDSSSGLDSDDGRPSSLPPPDSDGVPHVSAQAAAFEDSRQQRARGREGVRQQRETEQRAAEQHVAGQHAAERVAERMARDTEMPGINLLGQNNDMEDFEQGGGTSGNDAPPCYRSLSAALTLRGSDQEDDDDDDVSMMAGSEATNHEEDPGYASDRYGADTEDMEE